MYKPLYFGIQEFVPRSVWLDLREQAWLCLDERIVWTIDQIRAYYQKPITVNNWHVNGRFEQRGYRTIATVPYSQHRFGRALDFDIDGITAEEFRQQLKKTPNTKPFELITACELDVNWCHIDCRYTGLDEIFWFKGK